MNDEVETIFEAARKISDPGARAVFLNERCRERPTVRNQVEALLRADASAGCFLETCDSEETIEQSTPPSGAMQPGEEIDRYKLLQQIGEGGFGAVWMAEQRAPVKRRVALKIIKLGMDTKQVIARFEAERQALAMMDHPNIAKVFDAGSTKTGRPYFVMEYIKGIPILDYCDTERLDTTARLKLFAQVCHAIQHAHQKGIIHRDIKPSNVLVTLHDGTPVPKVIDFGIAKATNAELTSRTMFTEHRQMIGTPAYMSPEQAEMSGLDVDTRSDIYSLGVLLYELLTGTTPFENETLMKAGLAEMMRIIREEEPHRPSTRLSTLGDTATRMAAQRRADVKKLGTILRGDLDWIVMKCLEKDRTRRYETANGLAADIQRHLSDEPVAAGPPSARYKLRKFVKRNRGRVVAAGAVVLVFVLGLAGTTGGLVWALDQKDRAEIAETATQHELTRATEIKRLIIEMLSSIDPAVARSTDTTLLKSILDSTAERIARGELNDEVVAAELHHIIGDVYKSLGMYDQASEHLPLAVEINTRLLGDDHLETLETRYCLAALYVNQSRHNAAASLASRTLEDRRRVLGPTHRDTLAAMSMLAIVYVDMHRFEEAEELLLETLEVARATLGESDPFHLPLLNNLGVLYNMQARFEEAESVNREVVRLVIADKGREHPHTIAATSNLASTYEQLGREDDAIKLHSEALAISRQIFEPLHPTTLEKSFQLACCCEYYGHWTEAEPLYLSCIEGFRSTLGLEHRNTLAALTNLGGVYNEMGRHADAVEMLETSLPIKRRILGPHHGWTRYATMGLITAYIELGRAQDAETLAREWLGELESRRVDGKAAPTDDRFVAWILTRDIEGLRDLTRALDLAASACEAAEESRHPDLAVCLDTLARAQHLTGDTALAIEIQRRVLELSPNHAIGEAHLAEYEAALSGGAAADGP
ncbi:MAG: tetratricopeptide repeat protein [Phycisphaerales bacterium]